MAKIELIQGTMDQFGGYSVNGAAFVSEEAEALVDEAKAVAFATGRQIEEVLEKIIPPYLKPQADIWHPTKPESAK